MSRWVFLFPGQGSQYVGMGADLVESFGRARELFDLADDTLGYRISEVILKGPDELLTRTDNVQPALCLVSIVLFELLKEKGITPKAAAGHSLGEYGALYAAGVLTLEETLRLTRFRGRAMQEAADKKPGGMAAIMGLSMDRLEEVLQSSGAELANLNSSAQIIISGPKEALERAVAGARERGAKRVVPLNVSGPWHSSLMEDAARALARELAGVEFSEPALPVVNNVDAAYLESGEDAKDKLARQVISPVLWQSSMELLVRDGYGPFLEVGPKRVLTGLMRRIHREAELYNVEDVESLRGFIAGFGGG